MVGVIRAVGKAPEVSVRVSERGGHKCGGGGCGCVLLRVLV